HNVLTADCGEQAVEVFRSGTHVDLHILDLVMPGMDGLETIGRLRESGFGDVPVVILTAMSSDDNLLEGYRAGAGYYLTKPFKPASLLNIVDYLLADLSEAERERLALRL
ncbi:MAG TPA: response regulator, partial [Candidatus Acidoferrales bacterium]|nr:response regulator [Candidatus Acidoferrales bacterium]